MKLVVAILTAIAGATASSGVVWYPPPPSQPSHVPGGSFMPWAVIHDGESNPYAVFINKSNKTLNYTETIEPGSIKFQLYTSSNASKRQEILIHNTSSLLTSSYNSNFPTKVVIHGYFNDGDSPSIQTIKDAFLKSGSFNVIGVDWSKYSTSAMYNVAAHKTPLIGEHIAHFLDHLIDAGQIKLENLHIIGYSLGAHVAGFVSKHLKAGKPPRITGLDPARPLFDNQEKNGRLDASDGKFVDCIHTSAGFWGIEKPICHADFYPNGGHVQQPGCSIYMFGTCSHARSYEYFAESILKGHWFFSAKCKSLPTKEPVTCKKSRALMGYPATPKYQGIYYTTTHSQYPYALNIHL